jgi:hypothetical protein
VTFLDRLWRSARRPAVARRCLIIALVVGSILTAVNQWEAFVRTSGGGFPWIRVAANYLVPFVVSNLGAMVSHAASDR